ncbi:MAG: ABC transporter permease [Hungatella sp.]|jgi:multidrug/hemolysin transport system permease protein|nr:ABC transporter permease [Hungatella sp.]
MFAMLKRNLLIYLRDRSAVFFSILSVLIAIGLYILFLAQSQVTAIGKAVEGSGIYYEDINWLVNCWIISGLLSIIPVTSCLGVFGIMVEDREKKITKDFKSAPVNPVRYPILTMFSSGIIGILMSLMAFVLYSLYIYMETGYTFDSIQVGKVFFLIILTTAISCTVMGFLVSFLKTSSSYRGMSVVIGTVIGFVNGVYVPAGEVPDTMRLLIKMIPFSHTAVIFRKVLMENAIEAVFGQIKTEAVQNYKLFYGIDYIMNDKVLTVKASLLYVALFSIFAFFLYLVRSKNKAREY